MPIPGWTLPGVMTAGCRADLAEIGRDGSGTRGFGWFWSAAVSDCSADGAGGVPPLALIETQTTVDFLRSLRHLPGALLGWRYLWKGAGLLASLRKAGVRRFKGATQLEVLGQGRAQALRFFQSGAFHRIACDTVLLHHGVVPNTQATRSLRLPHVWNDRQRAFWPISDLWGGTSHPNIFVAGDGAGIGGATVAALSGQLAASEIAHGLGHLATGDRDLAARPLRFRLWLDRAVRPFLDTAFPAFARRRCPQRQHRHLPLRRGHGGGYPALCWPWLPWAEPDQSLWSRGDGAVPRALLRADSDGTFGRPSRPVAGPSGRIPHTSAAKTSHACRNCRAG